MRPLAVPRSLVVLAVILLGGALSSRPASAQETPRHGGELVFVVPGEPPSYDAHRENTLQCHRIIPHSRKVRGWTITPSHFLNNQLDTVWLTE